MTALPHHVAQIKRAEAERRAQAAAELNEGQAVLGDDWGRR